MSSRLWIWTAIALCALGSASCAPRGQSGPGLAELEPVYAEVTALVATEAVRLDLASRRYLRIGIVNSPLADLPAAEKQQKALEIAKRAYVHYPARSALRVVDVAFIVQGTRFLFVSYQDGRDSFRFAADDLTPPPTEFTEGWVPAGLPPNDLYFVAVGEVPAELVAAMVSHFQEKFGFRIAVLPPFSFDRVAYDWEREQLVADEVIAAIRFRYASLARNPRTRVIAITAYDMYNKSSRDAWAFSYSLRSHENRFAVVSYARMDPSNLGDAANEELLRSRLRKMLTKNIGIMHFGLPPSADPRSVLYERVLGITDLDEMSEYFDPREPRDAG